MSAFAVILVLLHLLSSCVQASPLRPSSSNCAVSQPPPATEPTCSGNSTRALTLAEAAARAIDFAPIVRSHPLETWHLQSPDVWYNAAVMLMSDTRQPPDATFKKFISSSPDNFMLGTPQTYLSVQANTSLSDAARAQIIAGAAFDAQNRSTARVAFTVAPYNASGSFFVYTYHLFYALGGCSNQDIVVNLNGNRQQPAYTLCLPGAQAEADWEHVSVLVCASDMKMKQVSFGQRRWVEVRDCEREGQCKRDPDTGRLVVYAALGTHGSYPQPSQLVVYDYLSGNLTKRVSWPGLGALYFGDRTLASDNRRWEPRPELLMWTPPLGNANVPANTTKSNTTEWMRYGGTWGGVVVQPNTTLTCIEQPEQNATVPCPGSEQAVNTIYQVTKLLSGVNIPGVALDPFLSAGTAAASGALSNNSFLLAQPPRRGPLAQEFSMTWVTEPTPPIQSKNFSGDVLPCPADLPVTPVVVKDIDPSTFSASASTIVDYIVGVAIGIFLFSLVLVAVLCLPAILDKKARVQRLVASKGGWGGAMEAGARGMMQKGVRAAKAGVDKVDNLMDRASSLIDGHPSKTPPNDEETGGGAEAPAGDASGSAAAPENGALAPLGSRAVSSYVDADILLEAERDGYTVKWAVWFIFGAGLWAAGIGTAIYGTWVIFNQSIISAMITTFNQSSLGETMEILFTLLLSVIAGIDLMVLFVLFFMKPAELVFLRWRVKNWLGGWRWARNHEWALSLTCVALVVLALCICAFYFALGFLVTVIQVAARMVCKRVMNVSVLGTSARELCVDIPFVGGDTQVCGYQALEVGTHLI